MVIDQMAVNHFFRFKPRREVGMERGREGKTHYIGNTGYYYTTIAYSKGRYNF